MITVLICIMQLKDTGYLGRLLSNFYRGVQASRYHVDHIDQRSNHENL